MFELPRLQYPYNSFEPLISERAFKVHHVVHYKGYIDKLNATLRGYPDLVERAGGIGALLGRPSSIPSEIKEDVINFGGGVFNHQFFWDSINPAPTQLESAELLESISRDFGSVDRMLKEMVKRGKAHFGSGWVWLVVTQEGELKITTTKNQDTPMMRGHFPLLTFDLWEHAYYLDYLADREKFLSALCVLVNWDAVQRRYEAKENFFGGAR
jgi:Fe-Mn family superoxide dismutase